MPHPRFSSPSRPSRMGEPISASCARPTSQGRRRDMADMPNAQTAHARTKKPPTQRNTTNANQAPATKTSSTLKNMSISEVPLALYESPSSPVRLVHALVGCATCHFTPPLPLLLPHPPLPSKEVLEHGQWRRLWGFDLEPHFKWCYRRRMVGRGGG